MKISNKYHAVLEVYLEWSNTRTPASGSFQEGAAPRPNIRISEGGISAAEAMCIWESTGKSSSVCPEETSLLERYIKGKSQRDWWTKEIGWWDKNAVYMPEEFINFLHPLNFIELFGRGPIPRLVRCLHDNSYRSWEFKLDCWMQSFVSNNGMEYYEREERHSAIENAWRIARVKYIEPFVYKVLRKLRRGEDRG